MTKANADAIYIPIWLDLLFVVISLLIIALNNLHSNMVRFIIIYIPKIN